MSRHLSSRALLLAAAMALATTAASVDAQTRVDPAEVRSVWVLSIGVDGRLQYAAEDAKAFAEAIREVNVPDRSRRIFVRTLVNEEATSEAIRSSLEAVARRAGVDDLFIFFYSGLGSTDAETGEWNLLPFVPGGLVDENAPLDRVPAGLLQTWASRIHAQSQLFLLDSGGAGGAVELATQISGPEAVSTLSAGSIGVLSTEHSMESHRYQHGEFTAGLLRGLTGRADLNGNGAITFLELSRYLQRVKPVMSLVSKFRSALVGRDFAVGFGAESAGAPRDVDLEIRLPTVTTQSALLPVQGTVRIGPLPIALAGDPATALADWSSDWVILVNGLSSPLGGDHVDAWLAAQPGGFMDVSYDVPIDLAVGTNEVLVERYGPGGLEGSTRLSLERVSPGVAEDADDAPPARRDYALLFGTDTYAHWSSLANPVADARTVAAELRSRYGFETEVVENASLEEMVQALRPYVQRQYGPDDQLFVFFAGHGTYSAERNEGYIVARDTTAPDPDEFSYLSYFEYADLRKILDSSNAEHILLVLDVCYGGTFDPQLRTDLRVDEAVADDFVTQALRYRTRRYITAGGAEYVSDGVPGRHSPFARALLEGLRSGRAMLTFNELFTFVERAGPGAHNGSFGRNEPGSSFFLITDDRTASVGVGAGR